MKRLLLTAFLLGLISCEKSNNPEQTQQIKQGEQVFATNCATCHGKYAEGITEDWKKPMANGKYPAPPLDGTAHAWHHPPKILTHSIKAGGAKVGGWMPAFDDKLSDAEIKSVLAYLKSLWPDKVVEQYNSRFGE